MVLVLHCFSFETIVPCSLVVVFFSFVSRSCIALKKKRGGRKEGKRKHIIVLTLFSLFLKTRLVNLFSHDISIVLSLALMSLFIALTSGSFVEHVVWKICLWCLSLCFYLEVICYLTVGLEYF